MAMRRRDLLAALVHWPPALPYFPTPAIAQGLRELKPCAGQPSLPKNDRRTL